ncbi:hypothetical protein [Dyadobacter psychrophilus]|uniref:Uncharacterized protein n=1 Tax=Dyadobacter psychrophilus TaxID=651661 RepID=A0A1T5GXZ0_9BACT|nr:hypothetical protein [Dyadobacter psychrophilus]SKC13251.1 hypothetical protein SAMN05660293_04545 [Dyadobacter psychrophilus]
MRIVYLSLLLLLLFSACKKDRKEVEPEEILTNTSLVKVEAGFEKALIRLGIDKSGKQDGLILYQDVKDIDSLYIKGQVRDEIQGLGGIEYFTNLRSLTTLFTKPDSLDLSKNTKLEYLHIQTGMEVGGERNALRYLNVRNCKELKYLRCSNNLISTLDLSQNTLLKELHCHENFNLKTLDLSKNTELEVLTTLMGDEFKELDLKHNSKLRKLLWQSSGLGKLDISNLDDLTYLYLRVGDANFNLGNKPKLDTLILTYTNLNSLDLTKTPNLVSLELGEGLESVDLSALKGLKRLSCVNSGFTELNLSSNTLLTEFFGSGLKQLSKLDLRSCKDLVKLTVFDSPKLASICLARLPVASDLSWQKPEHTKFEVCK